MEPRVKITFGKASVRPHVRAHKSGKKVAVRPYDTKRPPGTGSKPKTAHTEREFLALTPAERRLARAPKCCSGKRGKARMECDCGPCAAHQSMTRWRQKDAQGGTVHKALERLDDFLRGTWKKATAFLKGDMGSEVPALQHAEETLGAAQAPIVELAEDLASARDFGPETDEQLGYEALPYAAEDHASAEPEPIVTEEVTPFDQMDTLAKARVIQQGLQIEIEALDQQLAGTLPDQEREALLVKHLDYLIKADALTGKLARAEATLTQH